MMDNRVETLAKRFRWTFAVAEEVAALVEETRLTTLTGTEAPSLVAGVWEPEPTKEYPRLAASGPAMRYHELGPLGQGGMGTVTRVRDGVLNRIVAMKVINTRLAERPMAVARFIDEAQATAQLQHPGIVPVHELGQLDDGRWYYTMPEVRGRTLASVIDEVHAYSDAQQWGPTPSGWTMRRLVTALRDVCEAVGFAHSRGVVHRDLKPSNIMVGNYGEVFVLDWGLAKLLGQDDLADEDQIVTERSGEDGLRTRVGSKAGTPAYMSPEQARGDNNLIGVRSDVWSLGGILYEILGNRPPQPTSRAAQVTMADLDFDVLDLDTPLGVRSGPPWPRELVAVWKTAMQADLRDRFEDGTAMAAELTNWLDGARKREQARQIVADAAAKAPEADALRVRARDLRAEADALLDGVADWEPEERKADGWARQDEAARLEREADLLELRVDQMLSGALTQAPDLREAHEMLAERYRRAHQAFERDGDEGNAARFDVLLRSHVEALSESSPVRARHAAYLRGVGALTLVTEPAGAEVLLHRYELKNRRLVPVFDRSLGKTPLAEVALPMGSYLCVIRSDGRAEVRYPVHIGRQEHWDGVPPEGGGPHPVYLPTPEEVGDACYVPAGWFIAGDAGGQEAAPWRRLWCGGFAIGTFSVTNRQYLAFLDDLLSQGREADALRWVPRQMSGTVGELGAMIYGRRDDGRFELRPDAEGDVWGLDWPVLHVDWGCASGFAAWCAERDGRPWRLLHEMEWEKAGRGVDGRAFPWGEVMDPSWCCTRRSHPHERGAPSEVGAYPVDTSPYGVRAMAGNVREWCGNAPDEEFAQRVPLVGHRRGRLMASRGGAWTTSQSHLARLAWRGGNEWLARYGSIGMRIGRTLGP